MRAAVLQEYGTPRCGEFDDPTPSGEQIVLDVCAAGVNPFDVLVSSGSFYIKPASLPCVVGLDGVGRLEDGRTVYFESTVSPYGAAAERTLVEPHSIIDVPDGLDVAVAASLGNAGLAAWLSLEWCAELAPGETVLVLGATGTVGRLAVQMAKLLGAGRVIAAGRDPQRLHRAIELGADASVMLERADTTERLAEAAGGGTDVIIDLLWGAPAGLAVQTAARGSRIVQVGSAAGLQASFPAAIVRSKAVAILGYANYHAPRAERHSAYRRIAEHAAAGRITVDLERVPLANVETAWERQRSGASHKLVLIPEAA